MGNFKRPLTITSALLAIAVLSSACSLDSGRGGARVRVSVPARAQISSGALSFLHAASVGNLPPAPLPPTSLNDIACWALNVSGSNIPQNTRIPSDTCSGESDPIAPALVVGTVGAQGGEIEALVPQGPDRTFQLIGFSSSTGYCPSIDEMLANDGPKSFGLSDPYEIARSTVDVFDDAVVELSVSDAAVAAQNKTFCDAGSGPGPVTQKLNLSVTAASTAGNCEPVTISLTDLNDVTINAPAGGQPVNLGVSGTGTGSFSFDSCATFVGGGTTATIAPATSSVLLYYQPQGAGTVTLNASAPSSSPISASLTQAPGPQNSIIFTQIPGTTLSGSVLMPPPQITVLDAFGNVTTGSGSANLSVWANAGCTVAASGTLGGPVLSSVSGSTANWSGITFTAGAPPTTIYLKAMVSVMSACTPMPILIN
jgi:hypothetical protein